MEKLKHLDFTGKILGFEVQTITGKLLYVDGKIYIDDGTWCFAVDPDSVSPILRPVEVKIAGRVMSKGPKRVKLFDLSDEVQAVCFTDCDAVTSDTLDDGPLAQIPMIKTMIFSTQIHDGRTVELMSEKPFDTVEERDFAFKYLNKRDLIKKYNEAAKTKPLNPIQ